MLSIWRANPTQLFMTWVMYSNHQSVNMTWNTAKDKMKSNALEQFVDWIVAMIIMWMCWEFFWEIIECFDLRDDHNAFNCLPLWSSPTSSRFMSWASSSISSLLSSSYFARSPRAPPLLDIHSVAKYALSLHGRGAFMGEDLFFLCHPPWGTLLTTLTSMWFCFYHF